MAGEKTISVPIVWPLALGDGRQSTSRAVATVTDAGEGYVGENPHRLIGDPILLIMRPLFNSLNSTLRSTQV